MNTRFLFTLPVLMLFLTGAFTFGCVKNIEQNEKGPGGLPKVKVEENRPPATNTDYPVYPGATLRATNVYETRDSIDQVKSYYKDLLNMEPEIPDEPKEMEGTEVFTFITPEYELVILALLSAEGGTEIHFNP
ncbi:MAG: hypothetical protein ABIC40_04000, partial [bacterium]